MPLNYILRLTGMLLLPALAFSYLGSATVLRIGNNFYPELALLPWALFYARRPGSAVAGFLSWYFARRSTAVVLLAILLLGVLGGLQPTASLVGVYANARALLIATIAFQAASYSAQSGKLEAFVDALIVLCLLATSMSLFQQLVLGATGVKSPIPIAAPIIALVLSAGRGRFAPAMIAFGMVVLCAITGFFRQYVVLAALSTIYLIVCLLPLGVHKGRLALSKLRLGWLALTVVVAAVAVPIFAPSVLHYVSSDESRFIQAIGKWGDFWTMLDTGVSRGSEAARAGTLGFFLDRLDTYSVPSGFVDDDQQVIAPLLGGDPFYAYGVSATRDSVAIYSIVTFGSILTGLALAWLIYRTIRLSLATRGISEFAGVMMIAATFAVFLFLDGTAVIQVEKAFFTGTLVAMLAIRGLVAKARTAPQQGQGVPTTATALPDPPQPNIATRAPSIHARRRDTSAPVAVSLRP